MVNYPVSTVNTIATKLKYAEVVKRVKRPTYPAEWRLMDEKETADELAGKSHTISRIGGNGNGTGGYGGGSGRWYQGGGSGRGYLEGGLGGDAGRGQGQGDWGGKNGGGCGGGGYGQNTTATDHVHPKIVQVMKPLWDADGTSVHMNWMLDAANIQLQALPSYTYAWEGNINKLCYPHVCGRCRFGIRCNFMHVPGYELGDGFAEAFAQKVKPVVEYLARQFASKDGGGKPPQIRWEAIPTRNSARDEAWHRRVVRVAWREHTHR